MAIERLQIELGMITNDYSIDTEGQRTAIEGQKKNDKQND